MEPNCEFNGLQTARGLLESEITDKKRGGALPPSFIYVTAAILKGCSFVNGGIQNTLCGGFMELARQSLGVYFLGTDFKAGRPNLRPRGGLSLDHGSDSQDYCKQQPFGK